MHLGYLISSKEAQRDEMVVANRRLGALAPNNGLDLAKVPRAQLEKTREVQLIGHMLSKER